MEITEKVAYLKGLMEGMKIDTETNEGKILSAMVDILEDIGLELEDLWNAQGELEDGLDVVSDDLEDVEDAVYGEDDDEDEDEEPAEETEASPEEVLQYAWETVCYVIWGKASAKGGQKVVEAASEELKERYSEIFQ